MFVKKSFMFEFSVAFSLTFLLIFSLTEAVFPQSTKNGNEENIAGNRKTKEKRYEKEAVDGENDFADPLVLDLGGNGLDLSGKTKTELVTGKMQDLNWTKKDSDDGFIVLDAVSLKEAGFNVRTADGNAVEGSILFRDGLIITGPDGKDHEVSDAFEMLALFDSSLDGKVDSSDTVWKHMKLFVDANADGTIGSGELRSMADAGLREIALFRGDKNSAMHYDLGGNKIISQRNGFTRIDGTSGVAAAVILGVVNKKD